MKNTIIVLCAALAMGGCSIQKKCKAPQLELPAEIVSGQRDSLAVSDLRWWEIYRDPILSDLIRHTLEHNRGMLSAESYVRQMEELHRITKTAFAPSVNGQANADRKSTDYYERTLKIEPKFGLKATLSWELDLWGNLRWAKRKGAADYMVSVEAQRAMQMSLVAQVATAYFELVALDHELEIIRRTVLTREESVRQAKLRFEGGLTSETAYQQAKVELASASAMIPDLELKITQKGNQISVLAGEFPLARDPFEDGYRRGDARFAGRGTSFHPVAASSRSASGRAATQIGHGGRGYGLCRPISSSDDQPFGRCREQQTQSPARIALLVRDG